MIHTSANSAPPLRSIAPAVIATVIHFASSCSITKPTLAFRSIEITHA